MTSYTVQDKGLGRFSPELKLMLVCTANDAVHARADEINALLAGPMDWDLLLQLAVHHRVYPLVYNTLRSLRNFSVPEETAAILRQKCRNNAMRSLRVAGATTKIVQLLEANNIRVVVMKGPPLAQRIYGDTAVRPSKDVDIRVWPNDLEQACQLLEQQGYRMTHPDFPLSPARWKVYMENSQHCIYLHSVLKIEIELHWRLGPADMDLPLPDASRIQRIVVLGHSLPVLADEEWFLFLILHGARHSWFRLRWLCDIGEFMRQPGFDWQKVSQMAHILGIQPVLHQALILANQLLMVSVPEVFRTVVSKDDRAWQLAKLAVPFFNNACYEPHDSNRRDWRLFWQVKYYDIRVRTSWRKKFYYAVKLFSPNEPDIKLISLPDSLYPAYYALRPFTWLWRRICRIL